MESYVFILSPPYCGSTLLSRLLSTSEAISCLPREGQFIDGASNIMRQRAWNTDNLMPWHIIKPIWHQYWDDNKPYLLEKSPPNIVRASAIEQQFSPSKFILLVRNPYAHVEGLMRRRQGWDEDKATEFSIFCLKQQMNNQKKLKHTFSITYEKLCQNPDKVSAQMIDFLPKLDGIDISQEFNVHSIDGQRTQQIKDYNAKKIRRLSTKSVQRINSNLEKYPDIMKFWGYDYYEPSRFNDVQYHALGAKDFWDNRILRKIKNSLG